MGRLSLQLRDKRRVLKMNTALEYSTRVVQEGGRRCKKSTLNDLVHLTPIRIPLMNPPKEIKRQEQKMCCDSEGGGGLKPNMTFVRQAPASFKIIPLRRRQRGWNDL